MLAIPAFRRLWLAQLGSQLGEAIALVAMPLLVYGLTGSAELLSLIFILQLLPRVVLAPIAGMLADRLDRRRIILGADLARAGLVALLPFTDRAWQIALLAMLVAIGNALARPAELAAVPMVVSAGPARAGAICLPSGGQHRPHRRPGPGRGCHRRGRTATGIRAAVPLLSHFRRLHRRDCAAAGRAR